MQTLKENKEISALEARVIQYSKLVLALIFMGMIFYFLEDKTLLLICK